MRVKLVRIGNARGLRLSRSLLDQCGFGEEVDLEVLDGRLIVSPVSITRVAWEKAFAEMSAVGDDRLLGPPKATTWDRNGWEW